LIKTLKFIL